MLEAQKPKILSVIDAMDKDAQKIAFKVIANTAGMRAMQQLFMLLEIDPRNAARNAEYEATLAKYAATIDQYNTEKDEESGQKDENTRAQGFTPERGREETENETAQGINLVD